MAILGSHVTLFNSVPAPIKNCSPQEPKLVRWKLVNCQCQKTNSAILASMSFHFFSQILVLCILYYIYTYNSTILKKKEVMLVSRPGGQNGSSDLPLRFTVSKSHHSVTSSSKRSKTIDLAPFHREVGGGQLLSAAISRCQWNNFNRKDGDVGWRWTDRTLSLTIIFCKKIVGVRKDCWRQTS